MSYNMHFCILYMYVYTRVYISDVRSGRRKFNEYKQNI